MGRVKVNIAFNNIGNNREFSNDTWEISDNIAIFADYENNNDNNLILIYWCYNNELAEENKTIVEIVQGDLLTVLNKCKDMNLITSSTVQLLTNM